jgi:excisionase family DNA binding protein
MKASKPSVMPSPPADQPGPISPCKTIEEAAEYLKTTPWAIAQAIRSGDLQAKKVGKRFVTTVQFLDEWFSRQEDAA